MKYYKGIAGKRSGKLKGVMLHNDAGSSAANKSFYQKWLKSHPAENGFAHAYVTSTGTLLWENEANRAWHAGNATANNAYYSIEICQSKGNLTQFKKNEQTAFKLAAAVLKRNGLKANRNTVRLHREFYATSCPHRSWDIHGKNVNKVKDYFISEINKYMKPIVSTKPKIKYPSIAGEKVMKKTHKYKVTANDGLRVRKTPSVSAATYRIRVKGDTFTSRSYLDKNGYRWLSYVTAKGDKYWIAESTLKNKKSKYVKDIT